MAATILYVEDKHERLATLKAILQQLGYNVLTADNGRDALELFQNNPVQLAIVDYRMPGMMGDVVAHEIKRRDPNLPVIIFSGVLSLPERVMAMVDGFISTSEEPDSLLDKIAELLPVSRAQAG
jgi:DNA-binding NtrC family response regulator